MVSLLLTVINPQYHKIYKCCLCYGIMSINTYKTAAILLHVLSGTKLSLTVSSSDKLSVKKKSNSEVQTKKLQYNIIIITRIHRNVCDSF